MTEEKQATPEWRLIAQADQKEYAIKGQLLAGRADDSDLILTEGKPSRKHAKITVQDNQCIIEDLGSTNGTFVNGKKIAEPTVLNHNDVVMFESQAFNVAGIESDKTQFAIPPKPVEDLIPQSWAMERTKSVDSTHIMSESMLSAVKKMKEIREIAAKVEMPTLLGMGAPIEGKIFLLEPRDKVTEWKVGRAETCDVIIDHYSVSTDHAVIVNENNRWKLIDSMSANGTFVNGERGLTSYLSSGNTIMFGQVECQFLLKETASCNKKGKTGKQKNVAKYVQYGVVAVLVVVVLSLAVAVLMSRV